VEKKEEVCGLIGIEEKENITVQCTGCEQLTVCGTVFLTLTTKQYSLILLLIIQLFLVLNGTVNLSAVQFSYFCPAL